MADEKSIKRMKEDIEAISPSTHVGSPTKGHDIGLRAWELQWSDDVDLKDRRTAFHRIGRSAVLTLLVTTLLILAVVGFFSFIWHAGGESKTWHKIMVLGFAMRSVAVPSLLLRAAIDLQAGLVAAMLASLPLESGSVRLSDAAIVSLSRAQRARPRTLLFPLLRGLVWNTKRSIGAFNVAGVSLLCLTTLGLQFTTTILLSDLKIGTLPGVAYSSPLKYDFVYDSPGWGYEGIGRGGWSQWLVTNYPMVPRMPTWQQKPPAYPAFAEYSETSDPPDAVDDTGRLLRAFLPFPDAQSRQNLCNNSGKALVLDSRVSCQRPRLANLEVRLALFGDIALNSLVGTFAPSIQTDRLWTPAEGVGFSCSYLVGNDMFSVSQLQYNATELLSPSQFTNRAGGLIFEFANNTDPGVLQTWAKDDPYAYISWGTALMILNVSSSYQKMKPIKGYLHYKDSMTAFIEEYYSFKNDTSLKILENGIYTDIVTEIGPANLSLSICYTAWDTARVHVEMHGETNRTEPIAHWTETGFYTVPDVVTQLGNTETHAHAARGILSLTPKESWVPQPEDAIPMSVPPFVQELSGMYFTTTNKLYATNMYGNWSTIWSSNSVVAATVRAILYLWKESSVSSTIVPDPTLSDLFSSFMKSSGSLARTISSMITLLSSMAYYDQMPQYKQSGQRSADFLRGKSISAVKPWL